MADFDYSELADVATNLISDFGRDVQLVLNSQTPADSSKPWGARQSNAVASDDVTLTARAVFVRPEEEDRAASTIRKRRERAFVAGSSLGTNVLNDAWTLVDGTIIYEIVRVGAKQPGGTLLVYDLLLEV